MKSSSITARPYRMTQRARAVEETGRRILEATARLHLELYFDQVTLQAIADRAGVTVQTVIQRFGSKEALIEASAEHARAEVMAQRNEAPVGDIRGAVTNLMDHYEEMGDGVLKLLAQEDRVPSLRKITDEGRTLHRSWVERTFAPLLTPHRGRVRNRKLAQLVAVTDVYTWKLLRLDAGLDRKETERAIYGLITALEGAQG